MPQVHFSVRSLSSSGDMFRALPAKLNSGSILLASVSGRPESDKLHDLTGRVAWKEIQGRINDRKSQH